MPYSFGTFMRRAYRRPVTPKLARRRSGFYKEARAKGGFETGIEMASARLAGKPEFLFRLRRIHGGLLRRQRIAVATSNWRPDCRSFLWSSIPDDELLDAGDPGKAERPRAVLERQVRRMLADHAVQASVTNFAEQWLYLRNLASMTPDPRLFPDFDDNLATVMPQRNGNVFREFIREDRSVLDLLERITRSSTSVWPSITESRISTAAASGGSVPWKAVCAAGCWARAAF